MMRLSVDLGPAWGRRQLERRIAALDLDAAVFANRTFRRIAAPALDRRRQLLGRTPMWSR